MKQIKAAIIAMAAVLAFSIGVNIWYIKAYDKDEEKLNVIVPYAEDITKEYYHWHNAAYELRDLARDFKRQRDSLQHVLDEQQKNTTLYRYN